MSTPDDTLAAMLAMWNERDLARLRQQLEAIMAPAVEFVDPTIVTRGIDEFEANVRQFRTTFPEAIVRRTSPIDSHHRLHRYHWDITVGDDLVVEGFDVTELDDDDRVVRVLGFFGPLHSGRG